MTFLLDTDVLLDVVLDREPHAEPAGRLLDSLEKRQGTAFMASIRATSPEDALAELSTS